MERRRRRAQLTPLSGELKAEAEWAPADPVAEQRRQERPRRRRRKRQPPATRRALILFGLRRLALILLFSGGSVALVAALIVWRGSSHPAQVFLLAYYFAGAAIGAVAVLGGTGMNTHWYWQERADREQTFNMSFAYALIGGVLFAFGLALDSLL